MNINRTISEMKRKNVDMEKINNVVNAKGTSSKIGSKYDVISINNENEFVVYMYDGFDRDTCRDMTTTLKVFADYVGELLDVNEKLKESEQVPLPMLRIIISSLGGAMYDLLALANVIMELKDMGVVVITEANGYAMSCGFFLLMLGDIRTVTSDFCTELLYHEVQIHGLIMENANVLRKELERYHSKILRKFKDIMIEQTLVTEGMLKEYEEKDWVMDIEEARKLRILNDKYLLEQARKLMEDDEVDEKEDEKEEVVKEEVKKIEEVTKKDEELEEKIKEKIEEQVEDVASIISKMVKKK